MKLYVTLIGLQGPTGHLQVESAAGWHVSEAEALGASIQKITPKFPEYTILTNRVFDITDVAESKPNERVY